MLMRNRQRLALLICPELRPRPVRDDEVVNFFDAIEAARFMRALEVRRDGDRRDLPAARRSL